MKESINLEWASQFQTQNKESSTQNNQQNVEWIGSKDFKTMIKFKLLPANSKENRKPGGAVITGTHWNLGPQQDQRFLCPEHTFPEKGAVCPVCQLKRDLLHQGFTEEELTRSGKFGPMPLFDATITSSVKVIVIDTDLKHDWDQSHISVLQMKGDYLIKWIVQQYMSPETEDFLDWNLGATIKFSRENEKSKWNRVILPTSVEFNRWNPSNEVKEKIKVENEEFTLADLWKFPTDEQFLKIKQICDDTRTALVNTKEMQTKTVEDITAKVTMPF